MKNYELKVNTHCSWTPYTIIDVDHNVDLMADETSQSENTDAMEDELRWSLFHLQMKLPLLVTGILVLILIVVLLLYPDGLEPTALPLPYIKSIDIR